MKEAKMLVYIRYCILKAAMVTTLLEENAIVYNLEKLETRHIA